MHLTSAIRSITSYKHQNDAKSGGDTDISSGITKLEIIHPQAQPHYTEVT